MIEENFVRVYDNALSRNFCQGVISYFEWCLENNRTWDRVETNVHKKDKSIILNPGIATDINFSEEHLGGYIKEFNTSFWDHCYPKYRDEFSSINNYPRHTIFTYKVQKTLPGEGYHVWHFENDSVLFSRRILTYILYLNDIFEGGETELLYQGMRIPPKEGSLVIFPTAFTHTHRGNPPLKGTKYIMTGWVEIA